MSYASIAARNANQSPEEARAPPVDTIIPNESAHVENLVDVDSGVSVVPPDFEEQEVKTETQATRIELEEEAEEAAEEAEAAAEREKAQVEKKTKKAVEKVKKAVTKGKNELPSDPVVIANGVLAVVVGVVVGYGAYRKYGAGELSWKVAGIWGAGLAAFAAADVFASRYIMEKRDEKK